VRREQVLDKDLIRTELSFESAEDAIRYGGNLLWQKGYVEERYIELVLEREKVFPTGLPTEPIPIAIPHTDSGCVIKTSMCMLVLKEPLEFKQMGDIDKPIRVRIVMLLAVSSAEGHLEFLSGLMTILSGESLLVDICSAGSVEEIYEILLSFGDFFKS